MVTGNWCLDNRKLPVTTSLPVSKSVSSFHFSSLTGPIKKVVLGNVVSRFKKRGVVPGWQWKVQLKMHPQNGTWFGFEFYIIDLIMFILFSIFSMESLSISVYILAISIHFNNCQQEWFCFISFNCLAFYCFPFVLPKGYVILLNKVL